MDRKRGCSRNSNSSAHTPDSRHRTLPTCVHCGSQTVCRSGTGPQGMDPARFANGGAESTLPTNVSTNPMHAAIRTGRHADNALEHARQMALIGESTRDRDAARWLCCARQKFHRNCHASPLQPFVRREAGRHPECADEIPAGHAASRCEFVDRYLTCQIGAKQLFRSAWRALIQAHAGSARIDAGPAVSRSKMRQECHFHVIGKDAAGRSGRLRSFGKCSREAVDYRIPDAAPGRYVQMFHRIAKTERCCIEATHRNVKVDAVECAHQVCLPAIPVVIRGELASVPTVRVHPAPVTPKFAAIRIKLQRNHEGALERMRIAEAQATTSTRKPAYAHAASVHRRAIQRRRAGDAQVSHRPVCKLRGHREA